MTHVFHVGHPVLPRHAALQDRAFAELFGSSVHPASFHRTPLVPCSLHLRMDLRMDHYIGRLQKEEEQLAFQAYLHSLPNHREGTFCQEGTVPSPLEVCTGLHRLQA